MMSSRLMTPVIPPYSSTTQKRCCRRSKNSSRMMLSCAVSGTKCTGFIREASVRRSLPSAAHSRTSFRKTMPAMSLGFLSYTGTRLWRFHWAFMSWASSTDRFLSRVKVTVRGVIASLTVLCLSSMMFLMIPSCWVSITPDCRLRMAMA